MEAFIERLAKQIESDFLRWEEFEKSPRYASHSDIGVIELMPTADQDYFGFKYVNGHPSNALKGLQTIVAFGALSEVGNGYPILISEMTILTALRTAATSALAAKYLAPRDSETLCLIGNGSQAEFQALGFRALLGVSNLKLFDIDGEATAKCVRNLEPLGFSIEACTSAQEAVSDADIITTVTADKRKATILTDNMVGGGVHINGVGGDCPGKTEIHPDILHRSEIFVEYEPQTRIEGDIQQLADDHHVTELWRVFAGEAPGRNDQSQITFFDSVGFAVEDFSALQVLHEASLETNCFQTLDLIAEPRSSRDLYGVLSSAT